MMNSRWAVDANCGGTATLLSIGNPEQDNLIREETGPKVRRAIDRLPHGTLMLSQVGSSTPLSGPPAQRSDSRASS